MKLLGALLIILSGTGMGIYFAGNVKTRINSLMEMRKLLNVMSAQIRFGNSTLTEIAGMFAENKGTYQKLFKNMFIRMNCNEKQPFNRIWNEEIDKQLKGTCLHDDDIKELKRLGENMGSLDITMQIDSIKLYSDILDDNIARLQDASIQKTKLYYSLGVAGSIFLIIILY